MTEETEKALGALCLRAGDDALRAVGSICAGQGAGVAHIVLMSAASTLMAVAAQTLVRDKTGQQPAPHQGQCEHRLDLPRSLEAVARHAADGFQPRLQSQEARAVLAAVVGAQRTRNRTSRRDIAMTSFPIKPVRTVWSVAELRKHLEGFPDDAFVAASLGGGKPAGVFKGHTKYVQESEADMVADDRTERLSTLILDFDTGAPD